MRIGCDLDGCLTDFNSAFIELIQKETGIQLPSPSATYPTVWNYHRAGGVSAQQSDAIWDYIKSSSFWATLHPLKGALDAVQVLDFMTRAGHDVYFITSRPGTFAKYHTETWLKLAGMSNPTVLIADDKGPVVAGLQLDVFIDDKPENIVDAVTARPAVRAYVIDAPYNRVFQSLHLGLRVAASVLDVLAAEGVEFAKRYQEAA